MLWPESDFMIGVPTTLTNNPPLNQAGNTSTGSSNANITNALNYYGLKSGTITTPDANVISSADAFNPSNPNGGAVNHPVLSASGQWVSSVSGQPWHGGYTGPGGITQYFSNGQQVQDAGQVGLQTPQISVQQIQKDPALSAQVSGAITDNSQSSNLLKKSFADYLAEAQKMGAAGDVQLSQSQAAIDPSGTISRMNNDVTGASTNLGNTLNQYTTAQNQNQANIIGANQNYQKTQDAALGQFGTNLGNEQSAYEKAAQNVANQAYSNALKQVNLYQLTSGTPTSGSGQLSNRYISAYDNVNLPLQQQLAQMRMGTTNQLYNLGSSLQNQYLQNQQGQLAGQGALNSDLANRANSNNQYITGLDQGTAQYVQQLQQQVATMHPQLAMQYLQSLGIPLQTAQAIISGNTSNLSQLAGLDQSANAFNFVTPLQNNAPTYLSPGLSLPRTNSYTPTGGTGTGMAPLVNQSSDAENQFLNQQNQWLNTDAGKSWQIQNRIAQNNYLNPPNAAAMLSNPLVNNVPANQSIVTNDWAYTH